MLAHLSEQIESLPGVGPRRGGALRAAGISTVGELLLRPPRRYLDRSQLTSVSEAPLGEEITLICAVLTAAIPNRGGRHRARRQPPARVVVKDDSGRLTCIWFHGGQHLHFKVGDLVALSGMVEEYGGGRQMIHPEVEVLVDESRPQLHTGGIIPLYRSSAEMKQVKLESRGFRRLVSAALTAFADSLEDTLPAELRARCDLMDLGQSLRALHFPQSAEEAEQARRRLVFEELFTLQCEVLRQRKQRMAAGEGISFRPSRKFVPGLLESLPFDLTRAQERAFREIETDMGQRYPMRRLLHGEVGSGKTIVATCAMLTAAEGGRQAALMVPTEILAEQHFLLLRSLLKGAGTVPLLLTGGRRGAAREEALTAIRSGSASIVIGTHALIQEGVQFANLGLIVVDEQHRFGVLQRAELCDKGPQADMLVMTATPIPRSLALSLYGDLDVSVLDELPMGRRPVTTLLRAPGQRDEVYASVADELRSGHQAFIVFPHIEDAKEEGYGEVKSASRGFEELSRGALSAFELGLLHGRMSTDEKAEVMGQFASGQIQAIVCTTVIEVGVDIPNATIMVVEHAERFGLAQLHQLRGRVGRGDRSSHCVLVRYATGDGDGGGPSESRLQALCATDDGFAIARADLEIRGPGELRGTRQAGMPDLVLADPVRDEELLVRAREEAGRHLGVEG